MNAKKCKYFRRLIKLNGGDPKQASGATGLFYFAVNTLKLDKSSGRYHYKYQKHYRSYYNR